MNDLVTVIVPVYNVEKYLINCLNSIINQTHKNLEIIIVNDGSSDSSLEICESYLYDERVKLISIENSGQSVARNMALDIATGDYIVFCDSDDYYDIDAIEYFLHQAKVDNYDIVACGMRYIYRNVSVDKVIKRKVANKQEIMRMFCVENNILSSPCAKLYKKTIFNTLRYPVGKIYEDRYISLDIFANVENILFTGEIKYNYVQRTCSTVHSEFNKNRLFYIDISRRECEFISHNYPNLLPLIRNKVAKDIVEVLHWIIYDGCKKNYNIYLDLLKQLQETELSNGIFQYSKYYKMPRFTRLIILLRKYVGNILRKVGIKSNKYQLIDIK